MLLNKENWKILLREGFELKSSGTTGDSKTIFQPPSKLLAANKIALDAQQITKQSRILTVCSMSHAGGLLAQTLPALSINAHVEIKPFNAYRFWDDIQGFTHTHLTPTHCQMLINTKTFTDINLKGLFITCGSDQVSFHIIKNFVQHGATFMCNWGMTEIGPVTINTVFDSIEKVSAYQQTAIRSASLMGDQYYCDYKIQNSVLYVKGPTCVYEGWFNTGDRVELNNENTLYYLGRAT
ncbi:MAG: AMP-binding protein [Gammaproteobacteria bacterium]|nr:AMP-binding protein [Gammaproteobacteria bacterium]